MQLDLNGHYCLATQANYDKLVEDEYIFVLSKKEIFKDGFFFITEKRVYQEVKANMVHYSQHPTMHLHNNEWVFGSLEHEELKYKGITCRGSYALGTACGKCEKCKDGLLKIKTKPVEHEKTFKEIEEEIYARKPKPVKHTCSNGNTHGCLACKVNEPEPVEGITIEEALNSNRYRQTIYKLFDYIKYLEKELSNAKS